MPIWKVPQDHPQCNAFLGGLTELRKSLCSQPQCIIVKGHRCKLAKGRCLPSRVHRSPRCSFQLFLSVESCRWLLWFNVKCPLHRHTCLNIWFSASSIVQGVCETCRSQSLARGSRITGTGLEVLLPSDTSCPMSAS